jgi:Holliday junction resolvase RusA-like endonuclease
MSYKITLARESQSGNALAYRHWRVRQTDKRVWQMLLHSFLHKNPIPPATGKRSVTFTAFRRRMLDDDNLSSGLKHLRDCLTEADVIIDDNHAGASFLYVQKYAKESPTGAPMVQIDIEDTP